MSLVPEQARIPKNPYGAYDRKTPEWGQAATIADAMAEVLIRMDRSQVPALETQSTLPVVTAYEHQSRALGSVIRLIVLADEVESMWSFLMAGESAFNYHRNI